MDSRFQSERYTSQHVKDRSAGYEGYDLLCQYQDGATVRVARLVYWDAAPGFFVEMLNPTACIPLDIFEEFIAEVRANVRYY